MPQAVEARSAVISVGCVVAEACAGIQLSDLAAENIGEAATPALDQIPDALYGVATRWWKAVKVYAERMNGSGAHPVNADDAIAILAIARFGQIMILVNNAGVTRRVSVMDITEEDWDQALASDSALAAASLDRLLHHSHVVQI